MAKDTRVMRFPPRITPLGIVATFVSLTEAVIAYAITQVTGGVQVALTTFVIVFAFVIAMAFFMVLWLRPFVFYSPGEYGDTDPRSFVEAIRAGLPVRIAQPLADAQASPSDQEAQFVLINALLPQPVLQHLILMHEQGVSLSLDPIAYFHYDTGTADRERSTGLFSGRKLLESLDGTGLVEPTGSNVVLTPKGRAFAEWAIRNGKKAGFFQSLLGGWGAAPNEGILESLARGPQTRATPTVRAGGPVSVFSTHLPASAADTSSSGVKNEQPEGQQQASVAERHPEEAAQGRSGTQ